MPGVGIMTYKDPVHNISNSKGMRKQVPSVITEKMLAYIRQVWLIKIE